MWLIMEKWSDSGSIISISNTFLIASTSHSIGIPMQVLAHNSFLYTNIPTPFGYMEFGTKTRCVANH